MALEADISQVILVNLADKSAEDNNREPSSSTYIAGYLQGAIETAKNAVETAQAVSDIIKQTVGVVEDLGANAYDVVNELAKTLENPYSTQADVTTSGTNSATSKTQPQKVCGSFKLVSNLLTEVNELSSDLSFKVQVQTPAFSSDLFKQKHMQAYAYEAMLGQITDSDALVDEILNIAQSIYDSMSARLFVNLNPEESTSAQLVTDIQDKVKSAFEDVESLYTRYKGSVVFNGDEWLSALNNLTQAKDGIENELGDLSGDAGSYYGTANLKIIDQVNQLREKVCFYERSTNSINTTSEALQQIEATNVTFPIQGNSGSVIDRIRCHIDNIIKELERMKTAGVVTINMGAYKLYQTLQGLIIFMENSTDILKGLTSEQPAYKLNVPDSDGMEALVGIGNDFKQLCYDFMSEALSLSVTTRASTRLGALLTAMNNLAPDVKQYNSAYSDYLDIDSEEEYSETLKEATFIVDKVVQVFSDPGVREDVMSGNFLSAFSRIGYSLVEQRFLYVAQLVSDYDKREELQTQAEQRKYKRFQEGIDGEYLKITLDISLGTDKEKKRKELLEEYQSYLYVLEVLGNASSSTAKLAKFLADSRQNVNDYRAKLGNSIAVTSELAQKNCNRHLS